ncbi:PilZ domain-containing protein [Ectothiorhodospiraceae bacterium WFHF3C12]|nr:PilZ domain-containing protein [Ectothiorhodospiraceae bacterium WFHF3C12]
MDTGATLSLPGFEATASVVDISLKGALVRLAPHHPAVPEGPGRLCIELAPGAEIVMECEIAHREGRQLGLHCLHIDIDSVSHLRRLLELNLGDPELLNRELAEFASPGS